MNDFTLTRSEPKLTKDREHRELLPEEIANIAKPNIANIVKLVKIMI